MFARSGSVWTQQGAKLVGSGAAGNMGAQGASVAISADGSVAVVGGGGDDGETGAAWVYVRSESGWSQQGAKLVPASDGRLQGSVVALSGDGNTIIVGSPDYGVVAPTTVLASHAGEAWVYVRSAGIWTKQSRLIDQGVTSAALSYDGSTALLAIKTPSGSQPAGFVYSRTGGIWSLQGVPLLAADGASRFIQFPVVALSGDGNTAIIGASDDSDGIGAAWVFTRSGGLWAQQGKKLVGIGSAGWPGQGSSVALSADGNTAIVGGRFADNLAGAAWIFARSGSVWSQQGSKIVGTGAVGGALQGQSVSLSGNGSVAVVGGSDDNGRAGAAWVFVRSNGVWTQIGHKLAGDGSIGTALQGSAVAVSADGTEAVIGGPGDNGDVGAAWMFAIPTGPSIAPQGVLNGASFLPEIAPGAWITIQGMNLSATTRSWRTSDFVGGNLPKQLDDVSVTVGGKPAYISFISPTQLNVLTPQDSITGLQPVQVTTAEGKSNAVLATDVALSPALFAFSSQVGRYVAAVGADGRLVGPPNLIPGLLTSPVKPGDIILLFGTGFGPTTPSTPDGASVNPASVANSVTARIGGATAQIQFAGIVSPGLYQFNVVVPPVPNGDNLVLLEVGGKSTQGKVFVPVQP